MEWQFFAETSLKTRLLGVVIVLSFCLVVVASYQGIYSSLEMRQESRGLQRFNTMADQLLTASSHLALERGLTTTLLSSLYAGQPMDSGLIDLLHRVREKANIRLQQAIRLARQATKGVKTSRGLDKRLANLIRALADVNPLRTKVDALLQGASNHLSQSRWIEAMTNLINAGTRLRMSAFISLSSRDRVVSINRDMKQSIWRASEFAGLERAMIGQQIPGHRTIPLAMLKELNRLRSTVELELGIVRDRLEELTVLGAGDKTQLPFVGAIQQAYEQMERVFLGDFQLVREQVYAHATDGGYPISGAGWIRAATKGIDSILAINAAVSAYTNHSLQSYWDRNNHQLWLAIGILVFCLLPAIWGLVVAWRVSRRLSRCTTALSGAMEYRDLTIRLPNKGRDELTRFSKVFNQFATDMDDLMAEVLDASVNVSIAANEMNDVANRTKEGIRLQETESNEVSIAVDQMMRAIENAAGDAAHAAETATGANQQAHKGQQVTERAILSINQLAEDIRDAAKRMDELATHSTAIGGIVDVINAIAEQTNMLALNAAIEAARAGESGRGFAVVADEVRNLARRTQASTHEIQGLVEHLRNASGTALDAMARSREKAEESVQQSANVGAVLTEITSQVALLAEISNRIADSSGAQVENANRITTNLLANVKQFSSLSKQSVEQTSNASAQLSESVITLQYLVQQYRITDSTHIRLQSAMAAHMAWKSRVHQFMEGKRDLALEEAVSHQDCPFGKWYYSNNAHPYRHLTDMEALEAPHAEFHQTIGEIVRLRKQGRQDEALALVARVDELSSTLVHHILQIERTLGIERNIAPDLIGATAGPPLETTDVELF